MLLSFGLITLIDHSSIKTNEAQYDNLSKTETKTQYADEIHYGYLLANSYQNLNKIWIIKGYTSPRRVSLCLLFTI